jgi:tetratricopeptide (TPR) repeat protein
LDEARELAARAEEIYADLGQELFSAAMLTSLLAKIEFAAGDVAAAERQYRRSWGALGAMGDTTDQAWVAPDLAEAICAQGRYAEAEELTRLAEQSGPSAPRFVLRTRTVRARALCGLGRVKEAESLLRELLPQATAMGRPSAEANMRLALAEVLRATDRADEAVESAEQALALWTQKEEWVSCARAEALLAELGSVPASRPPQGSTLFRS